MIDYEDIPWAVNKAMDLWKVESLKVWKSIKEIWVLDFVKMSFEEWFANINLLSSLKIEDILKDSESLNILLKNFKLIEEFLNKNKLEFEKDWIVLVWDMYIDVLKKYKSLTNNLLEKVWNISKLKPYISKHAEVIWNILKESSWNLEKIINNWLKSRT